MSNTEELSFALRFINEHPKSAVRVLEQNEADAVVSLLNVIPAAYAASLVRYMMPEFAGRLLSRLERDKRAAVLSTLDANVIANILRLLDSEIRGQLLDELSTGLRKNTQLLLNFAPNTVGAWMSPYLLTVADDLKCKNILRTMRTSDSQDDSEYVYILNREGIYQGRTRLLDVLKAGENQQVAAIMDTSCPSLPAQMILSQANEHRAWDQADVLPVTNRDHQLLGILHHHALRQGLDLHKTKNRVAASGKDPVSSIFEVYGQSLLALLNSVSDVVENDRQ